MTRYFKSNRFLLFLLIPFFKPVCIQYFPQLHFVETLFVVWKVVAAGVGIAVLFIYMWEKSRLPKLIIWIALFESAILISTMINKGYLSRAIIDGVSVVAYVIILFFASKFNAKGLVHQMKKLLLFLMLINLATMLLFPQGLQAELYINNANSLYFMVIDNGSALFLCFCTLIFYLDGEKRKWIYLACVLSAFLSESATTIFTVLLLHLFIILVNRSSMKRAMNPYLLLAIYIGIFVFILSMQRNVVLTFILENIFERSDTFTGRYLLWEQAFRLIKQAPWLGYGRTQVDYIVAWGGHYSSHNYILELLLQGGVCALSLFFVIVVSAFKKTKKNKEVKIILISFWVILLAAMMESAIHSVYIFGTIAICYYCEYFKLENEVEK